MNSSPSPSQDLSKLIDQAQARVSAQVAAAEAAALATHSSLPWKLWFTTALWAGLGLTWAFLLWPRALADQVIAAELEFMIDAARADVSAEIDKEGRLPARLPDRFYAGTVRLEPIEAQMRPPVYRLTAELNGVRASWTSTDPEVKP